MEDKNIKEIWKPLLMHGKIPRGLGIKKYFEILVSWPFSLKLTEHTLCGMLHKIILKLYVIVHGSLKQNQENTNG